MARFSRLAKESGQASCWESYTTRFLDQPDEGSDSFFVKLQQQLRDSPPDVYQLMGEVLYTYYLILARAGNKQERINEVLGWSPTPVTIRDNHIEALQSKFISLGTGNAHMPFQVGTLIEFIEQWKELEPSKRDRLLEDPWEFKDFLFTRQFNSLLLVNKQNAGRIEKEALLHIVFPDSFETIGGTAKYKIASAEGLANFVTEQTTDVDRKILQIRRGLAAELGRNFYFHDADIRKLWDSKKSGQPESGNSGETGRDSGTPHLQNLADGIYLPVSFLENISTLLDEKKQVIFQGPPGTGKTYVAQRLAEFLVVHQCCIGG